MNEESNASFFCTQENCQRGKMMQPKADIQPKLLTPRQTATYLSISERKLWSLTNENLVPCIRIGRAVRYTVTDLNLWIESQRTTAE